MKVTLQESMIDFIHKIFIYTIFLFYNNKDGFVVFGRNPNCTSFMSSWKKQVNMFYDVRILVEIILMMKKIVVVVNPYAELLKWNNPPSIFGPIHYHFKGYPDENLKLVSQQYRAWSDCMDVQTGLALYWWQKLITFIVGRIMVKILMLMVILIKKKKMMMMMVMMMIMINMLTIMMNNIYNDHVDDNDNYDDENDNNDKINEDNEECTGD